MNNDDREALVQRVLDAHHFVSGKTVNPRIIRAIAVDLRAEFERAGTRWDEMGQLATRFLESWRQHPKLSREEVSQVEQAFREGFGLVKR